VCGAVGRCQVEEMALRPGYEAEQFRSRDTLSVAGATSRESVTAVEL
jgi:hypothetical protein